MLAGATSYLIAKDGRKVALRSPTKEDSDQLMDFINSLVLEGAQTPMETVVSREEEKEWLDGCLAAMERGELLMVLAEVGGVIIANCEVRRGASTSTNHVGVMGIAVKKGFRGIGIGKAMLKFLIEKSQQAGIKILTLDVFAMDTDAIRVHDKLGFRKIGVLKNGVFKDGRYIDRISMALRL